VSLGGIADGGGARRRKGATDRPLEFQPELSDDAVQKMREAQQNSRHGSTSPGRSYPGTGVCTPAAKALPVVGWISRPGGGGIGGGEDSRHGIPGGETGSPIGARGG